MKKLLLLINLTFLSFNLFASPITYRISKSVSNDCLTAGLFWQFNETYAEIIKQKTFKVDFQSSENASIITKLFTINDLSYMGKYGQDHYSSYLSKRQALILDINSSPAKLKYKRGDKCVYTSYLQEI